MYRLQSKNFEIFLAKAGRCCNQAYAIKEVRLKGRLKDPRACWLSSEGTPSILDHPSIVRLLWASLPQCQAVFATGQSHCP